MTDEVRRSHVVVGLASLVVPTCELASVVVAGRDAPGRSVCGDATAREADGRQLALAEGPVVDVLGGAASARSLDLAAEPRWPRWAEEASTVLGLRSVAAVPFVESDDRPAVLAVYAGRPGAFGEPEVTALRRLAERFAAGDTDPAAAVHERLVVAKAVGVLMQRLDLDEEAALDRLRRDAARSGRTPAETAATVVPGDPAS